MTLGAWRPALVLAARQARRQRLRAVAILATLAVPVAVVCAADVVTRTTHISGAERLDRQLSGAAAVIQWVGYPLIQSPDGRETDPVKTRTEGDFATPPGPTGLPALLPAGATASPEADAVPFMVSATSGTYVQLQGVDVRASGPRGGVRLRSGRAPAAADEVALSPPLASQLHTQPGDTLHVPGRATGLRIVGLVADRYSPGDAVAFALPGTAEALQTVADAVADQRGVSRWYVSSVAGIRWSTVEAFNARGWAVTSRAVIEDPPPHNQVPYFRAQTVAQESGSTGLGPQDRATSDKATTEIGAGLLAAMLLLEVVLMAGPAFAVGARRRRHELAVVSAGGGTRRQLIAVVAADGLLLGGVAAVAGAAAGVGAGTAVLAGLRAWTNRVPGPVTVRGWEILAIASLALVSGLLAAMIPAWSASRADTAQVLRGRQARDRLSWWTAAAGGGALAAAIALGLATFNEASPNGGFPVPLVLAAALAEIGFVLLTPAILAAAGRASPLLPLWPRIAMRDASRRRRAAGPAVAAIIAVVAATTAALVYGSSVAAHDRVSWLPSLPTGDAVAELVPEAGVHVDAAGALAAVRTGLPGAAVVLLAGQTSGSRLLVLLPPGCPAANVQFQSGGGGYDLAAGGPCAPLSAANGGGDYLVDSGPATATMLGGTAGRQAGAALQAGRAVVFDPALLSHGHVTFALGPGSPSKAVLPAVAVTSTVPIPVATIIVPPTAAAALRLQAAPSEIYVKDAAVQPPARLQAANLALARLGIDGLYVQGRYTNSIAPALLAVVGADLLLTIAATVAATALVMVDSVDDQLILAALGAAPRGRRRLAMSRAALIGAIGSIFGLLAGLIPGIELVRRLREQNAGHFGPVGPAGPSFAYPLHIPWNDLAIVLIAAPLLAAAVAAVLNRSTLPSEAPRPG